MRRFSNGVFRLLTRWLGEDTHDAPLMHAAVAQAGGRRFAFVADKGSGKTTLMLKLIEEGIAVEGDEHLVVTATGTIARPRRLHVKESSLDVMPELADAIRSCPFASDWSGNRVFACPPSFRGAHWTITERPVDHLVFIESNFGGSSILSALTRDEAFARLMETIYMPPTNRGAAAARLRVLSIGAKAWRLQAGNLDQAVWHLRKAAEQV